MAAKELNKLKKKRKGKKKTHRLSLYEISGRIGVPGTFKSAAANIHDLSHLGVSALDRVKLIDLPDSFTLLHTKVAC